MKPKHRTYSSATLSNDEIVRRFWAEFIGSKITKEGQVPGFRDAWNRLNSAEKAECQRYEQAVVAKIRRDGRDPEECIQAGVSALNDALKQLPWHDAPCPPSRAAFDSRYIRWLWSRPIAPTPQECATFLASRRWQDAPPELQDWIERLNHWPAGSPFPAIPDDDAMLQRHDPNIKARWFESGSSASGLVAGPAAQLGES